LRSEDEYELVIFHFAYELEDMKNTKEIEFSLLYEFMIYEE